MGCGHPIPTNERWAVFRRALRKHHFCNSNVRPRDNGLEQNFPFTLHFPLLVLKSTVHLKIKPKNCKEQHCALSRVSHSRFVALIGCETEFGCYAHLFCQVISFAELLSAAICENEFCVTPASTKYASRSSFFRSPFRSLSLLRLNSSAGLRVTSGECGELSQGIFSRS